MFKNNILYILTTITLTVFSTILLSCGSNRDELIAQRVAERVMPFRAKQWAECKAESMAQAEHIVDSLLLVEAEQELQDSLNRLKPVKPFRPGEVAPIDSASIKPLFDQ